VKAAFLQFLHERERRPWVLAGPDGRHGSGKHHGHPGQHDPFQPDFTA